ncbi:hypothetical protein GCM10007148_03440 [Parvularcula lutaonensis]|nr:hypothetical protein GCM10007148_03440 [Parvularcula lutaonensis]
MVAHGIEVEEDSTWKVLPPVALGAVAAGLEEPAPINKGHGALLGQQVFGGNDHLFHRKSLGALPRDAKRRLSLAARPRRSDRCSAVFGLIDPEQPL